MRNAVMSGELVTVFFMSGKHFLKKKRFIAK